jgi:hypothetical protein
VGVPVTLSTWFANFVADVRRGAAESRAYVDQLFGPVSHVAVVAELVLFMLLVIAALLGWMR